MPLELLRDLAGPDAPPPAATTDTARHALLAEIEQERAPIRRRRRRPRRRLVLAVTLPLAAAILTGAGYVVFKPAEISTGIFCAFEVAPTPSALQISADGRPFTEQCAAEWRAGRAGPGRRAPAELTACDSGEGAIFVYPAGVRVCAQLGMRAARDGPTAEERRFVTFSQALVPRIAHGCPSFARAEQIVRAELARAGLRGWTIRRVSRQGGTAARQCPSLAFRSGARIVSLVPLPRVHEPPASPDRTSADR
jgi:hypothetical protein